MGWTRWITAPLVISIVSACGVDELGTSETKQAATTNGAWQNGLVSNALFENGAWQNGAWQNGAWQNGVFANGAWQNGAWQNGAWQNGAWQNGAWQNGAWQNGAWQNGAWQNGAWQNGAWQNGAWQNGAWQNGQWDQPLWNNVTWGEQLWEGDFWKEPNRKALLQTNPYTARLLQYIYSCAMPGTAHKVMDVGDGVSISLDGGVGLAPQWDIPGGTCDLNCQRWVSACVLARTNAYGVPVEISMRVADSAPDEIKAALAVTDQEKQDFKVREGTYFGNIFQTTPVDATGAAITDPTLGAPYLQNTPLFYACSGPGSNIPDVTKRFCSSEGDGGPIKVLGECEPRGTVRGVCSGLDSADGGAERSCFAPAPAGVTDGSSARYDQVITVYIREPIAKCGNNVCEKGEDAGEANACPSDCHPDSRSSNYLFDLWGDVIATIPWGTSYGAVTPDGGFVLGAPSIGIQDLGGGPIGLNNGLREVMLAKYSSTGQHVWSHAYTEEIVLQSNFGGGLAVSRYNGDIAIGSRGFTDPGWLGRYDSEGLPLPGWPYKFGGPTPSNHAYPSAASVFDADGNVYMAGPYDGQPTFPGPTPITLPFAPATAHGQFVAKLDRSGVLQWATALTGVGTSGYAGDLALDSNGNLVVAVSNGGVCKVGANGAQLWCKGVDAHGIAVDANGDVFVGQDHMDATLWKLSGTDGSLLKSISSASLCLPGTYCSRYFGVNHVLVDGDSVIVTSSGGGETRGFDLGAGEFRIYGTPDIFVTAYATSDLKFRWSKHMPLALNGRERSTTIDRDHHLVMFGGFTGSALVDDRFLVTDNPGSASHPNTFIASFAQPPWQTDDTAPTMADIPNHIVVPATSAAGAPVWYALPTALDTGFAGTNVVCTPGPNSWFPIGDTLVKCTAWDPVANHTVDGPAYQFTVTVKDMAGPTFTRMPTIAASYEATSPAGAVVAYDLPLAFDEMYQTFVTVSCDRGSLTDFGVGLTNITCWATDANNNTTRVTIPINVVDTQAPTLSLPADFTTTLANPTYAVTATDIADAHVDISCVPSSLPLGETTTVTCTATDDSGNQTVGSFNVTRVEGPSDTTPPVITVPPPITVELAGPMGTPVNFSVTATDDVDGPVPVSCTRVSGTLFQTGTDTVQCTATDSAGNPASASFTVTVQDTTRPVIEAMASQDLEATGPNGAVATFTPSATDWRLTDVSCSAASGSYFSIGTTTVTCTATDAGGLTASTQFTITVHDTTPPSVTVPPSATLEATSAQGAVFTFTATAFDTVDGPVAVSCTSNSGSTFGLGSTTVTCTATDSHNNSRGESFTVTVRDTTAPVIASMPDLVLEATSAAGATASFTPSATDAVGVVLLGCTPAAGVFPVATTPVTCTARDAAGNAASTSFTVTVRDTTAPVITPMPDLVLEATSAAGAPAAFTPSATDAVGVVSLDCTPAAGVFPLATTPVTCTARDAAGNSSSTSFTVTVRDTTAPVFGATPDVTATVTSASGATVTYAVTASDLVSGSITPSCDHASGSTFPVGTTVVTCTASDAAGNSATRSFNVIVLPSWSFFLQPINSDGSSIFKQGSTIPVKFRLTGASAGITNLVATIRVQKVTNNVTGSDFEPVISTTADSGTTFRYDPTSDLYVFNLATSNLGAGTYAISTLVGTNVLGTVNVSIKK